MPSIPRCTAQIKGGRFCDAPALADAPFPICFRHAADAWKFMGETLKREMRLSRLNNMNTEDLDVAYMQRVAAAEEVRRARQEHLVYYIDFRDAVKIGATTNLTGRLGSFHRLKSDVLALEPGDSKLEHARHRQFGADRIDKRELFRKSDELMRHIEVTAEMNSDFMRALGVALDVGTVQRV